MRYKSFVIIYNGKKLPNFCEFMEQSITLNMFALHVYAIYL